MLNLIGSLLPIGEKLVDKLIPDPEERSEKLIPDWYGYMRIDRS